MKKKKENEPLANEPTIKIASIEESELLQKEGWIVLEVVIQDGIKLHKLTKGK